MVDSSWKAIAAEIASQIVSGSLAPGTRLPSGDQLARERGVNRNTAHRAIEDLQRQGLVVRRQGSGTVVADRSERKGVRIALLVDGYSDQHNFPSGDLLRGIHDRIGEESTLVIADSKNDVDLEARQLHRLAQEVDGILLYATALERPAALTELLQEGFPVVALDRVPSEVEIDFAVTDNRATVRKAVDSMAERGHRRVGFLSFDKRRFTSVVERFEGYREALEARGLFDESLVRWLPEGFDRTDSFGQIVQDTIYALTGSSGGITALFCVEDGLGCAAVPACQRLGIEIPTALELATYIDWHPMTLRTPWNVRRIVQRKYDLGQAAASLLLDRIASPRRPFEAVRIEAEIIPADADLQRSFASPTAIHPGQRTSSSQ